MGKPTCLSPWGELSQDWPGCRCAMPQPSPRPSERPSSPDWRVGGSARTQGCSPASSAPRKPSCTQGHPGVHLPARPPTPSSEGLPSPPTSPPGCSACPSWYHQSLPLPLCPRDSIFPLRRPRPPMEPRTLTPAPDSQRGAGPPRGASPRCPHPLSPAGPPASVNERRNGPYGSITLLKPLMKFHTAVQFQLFNLIRYNFNL